MITTRENIKKRICKILEHQKQIDENSDYKYKVPEKYWYA
jgi:hypothetical protein